MTQQAGNAGCYQQLLPGHQAAKAGPGGFADEESHHGVRDGIPYSSSKQDDGGIESIHLQQEKLVSGDANPSCSSEPYCDPPNIWEQSLGLSPSFRGI